MIKRFSTLAVVVVIMAFLFPKGIFSQDELEVYEPTAGNFFVVGARALGMGGAYIAVASDATALIYNPAGLARVTRIEFAAGLTHQRMDNTTSWQSVGQKYDAPLQNNTRFSSANLVLPVPTYRGSLVLALGVNRVHSFDRIMDYRYAQVSDGWVETGTESESGGLYIWSLGGAVDVSPNVSVGGALNLWSGKSTYTWLYQNMPFDGAEPDLTYDDAITGRYSGFNAKFGVRVQPNRYLVFGGTIDSPVTLTVKEDVEQFTDPPYPGTDPYEYYSDEYKVSLPFSMGAGTAFFFDQFTLAGDINYTDWTQMEYKERADMGDYNRRIKRTYTDAFRFHVGAEYLIPSVGVSLRTGFYRDPVPFRSDLVGKNRNFFTAGIGFLIDQVMTLDVAWAHGSWELQDFVEGLTEKYTTDRLFVSVAYRL